MWSLFLVLIYFWIFSTSVNLKIFFSIIFPDIFRIGLVFGHFFPKFIKSFKFTFYELHYDKFYDGGTFQIINKIARKFERKKLTRSKLGAGVRSCALYAFNSTWNSFYFHSTDSFNFHRKKLRFIHLASSYFNELVHYGTQTPRWIWNKDI